MNSKKNTLIGVIAGVFWLAAISCQVDRKQYDLLITNVNVVDVEKGIILSDRDIVIDDSSILQISPGGELHRSRFGSVYNGEGKFLIPGLWDMHAHPDDPEVWRMNPNPTSRDLIMPLFVLNGVTGIRDMGGNLRVIQHWRDSSETGDLLAPVIFACGPLLDGPDPMWDGSVGISSPEYVPAVVDSLMAAGADFLKVYSLLPRDIYFALADYATRKKIPFVGHVPYEVRASEAARTGMKSQEHLLEILLESSSEMKKLVDGSISFDHLNDPIEKSVSKNQLLLETFDIDRANHLFQLFEETDTYHTPTVSMWYENAWYEREVLEHDSLLRYLPAYLRKYWTPQYNDHLTHRDRVEFIEMKKTLVETYQEIIKLMSKREVQLMAGTDMGANPLCFPGWSLHWELELLVESGLLPEEALRTATVNPARFLGIDSKYGTIDVGKKADLVVLDENPLEKISNTQKIAAVVRDGTLITKEKINEQLEVIKRQQDDR